MGYLKSVGTAVIYVGLFLAVITFMPGLPPEVEFSEISIKTPIGVKDLKNRLKGAEVLFRDELKGPESFASYNGELYTSVHGGYVVRLEENRIVPIVKFGPQKCDHVWQEEKCGRPLGLKFNDKGDLFVMDAHYGIFKFNFKTKQFKNIVNISEPIAGKAPKIPNSLDIAKNGDIYWTDSSTDFGIHNGIYTTLANPSGRLLRYNNAKKKNEVLLNNIAFANGILLSDDESFVIVLECLFSRIIKYHLKGPKAGQHEFLVEALPGIPDNVHTDGQGGFLVSLLIYADADHPAIFQSLLPHPLIRKMAVRLLYLIEAPIKLLQDVYPNSYAERLGHAIGSFDVSTVIDTTKTSVVLRIDKTGKIVDAIYSDDKTVHSVSSAFIHKDYLYLGSPFNHYVQRVPLKQAFPDLTQNVKHTSNANAQKQQAEPRVTVRKTENVKTESKPVKVTTAKPPVQQTTVKAPTTTTTTTTPRPTTTTTTPKPTTTTTPKPTTTTPKPTTRAPTTQKPVTTTTTSIPTVSETAKPVKQPTNTKQTTSAPTTEQTTTRRPPTQTSTASKPTTTPPPPKATSTGKKDNVKSTANANNNAKQSASNVKTETPSKGNEAAANSKSGETTKQNARSTQSEKVKSTEKNRPKETPSRK